MARTTLALITLATLIAVATGCAKQNAEAGTTTVRSATPDGPRVTDVPPAVEPQPAEMLAAAICRHERACTARAASNRLETPEPGGAACFDSVKPTAVLALDAINCDPAIARAGLKDCLAALATDDCSNGTSTDPAQIRACRPSTICKVGQ